MTEYLGSISEGGLQALLGGHDPRASGLSPTAYSNLPVPNQISNVDTFGLLALEVGAVSGSMIRGVVGELPAEYGGRAAANLQDNWFERVIAVPGVVELGNVLSDQSVDIELVNLFRGQSVDWTAFTNNAGAGITPDNLPGLPYTLLILASFVLTITVSTNGPPTISGTLDFTTDQEDPIVVISGNRIIMFPYQPETNILETLEWNTEVLVNEDGTEQRIRMRRAPRQLVSMSIQDEGDNERDRLNAVLFDWHARVFGLPIWWEQRQLDADMAINDTVIQVDTTFADFRVGGLVMLWDSYDDFEAFEIDSITASSITMKTAVTVVKTAGVTVILPIRTAFAAADIGQNRFLTGPSTTNIKFTVLDNIDLSDVTGFPTYDSRVLIDKLNKSGQTKPEGLVRKIERLDNAISPPQQRSGWLKSKPRLMWRLISDDQQEIWEIRQLLHTLGGRQTAFWLGTGRTDINPVVDIPDLAGQIDVEFVDFGTFYQQQRPRGDIQIIREDGTTSQHTVTGSSVITPNQVERLTISPVISPALPIVDIDRIEYLTLSRLNSDKVKILHRRPNDATFNMTTTGVFE